MGSNQFGIADFYEEVADCMENHDKATFRKLTYKYHKYFKSALNKALEDNKKPDSGIDFAELLDS